MRRFSKEELARAIERAMLCHDINAVGHSMMPRWRQEKYSNTIAKYLITNGYVDVKKPKTRIVVDIYEEEIPFEASY